MQSLFSFAQKANAVTEVAKYEPQGLERIGKKLWFSYINKAGSGVSAYYDCTSRSFKSVVRGKQYGKSGYAVRNLVARPVIEGVLGK
tara:strand:+ start:1563 stop:1823 length:261 start_codon:yes stop_codon:yes gene_type:complete